MPVFTDGKLRCGQNIQRNQHFANIPWSSQNPSFVLIRFPCQRILLLASLILRAAKPVLRRPERARWRWESRAHISRVEIRVSFFYLCSFVVQSRHFLMYTNQNSHFVTSRGFAGRRVRLHGRLQARKSDVPGGSVPGPSKLRVECGARNLPTCSSKKKNATFLDRSAWLRLKRTKMRFRQGTGRFWRYSSYVGA